MTTKRRHGPAWAGITSPDDLRLAVGFGVVVGLFELQAVHVTTGQFSWPAAFAVLCYDAVAGFLAWPVLGSIRLLMTRLFRFGSAAAKPVGLGSLLAILLVIRCMADGIWVIWSPGLEQSRTLLVQALAICGTAGVALVAGTYWLTRRKRGSEVALFAAVAAAVAAMLHGGEFWRTLTVGHSGRTAFTLHVAWCTACSVLAFGVFTRLPRRYARTALALVFLLPMAGRFVVGPPSLSSVQRSPAAVTANSAPGQVERPPTVILIVLDTLRADHLDLYGYSRPTSPNLTRFAIRATTFSDCISNASWTLPGHASLFTGLYSREHGAHGGQAGSDRPGPHGGRPLTADRTTLAEVLRDHGYRTSGIASNWLLLDPTYGLSQGFEHWDSRPAYRGALTEGYFPLVLRTRSLVDSLGIRWIYRPLIRFDVAQKPYRRAEAINDAVLARLDEHGEDDDRPFFLFVNYMDAHDPYIAPVPFADRFPGRLRDRPRIIRALTRADRVDPGLREHLVSQYDSEIAYLDHHLGDLLDRFEERGILETSLIVITSDHGEAFGEHDYLGHGKTLYREELRVPLIVYDPAAAHRGSTIDTPVELRSVMPWILSRLGLDRPPSVAPGDLFAGSSVQIAELYGGSAGAGRSTPDERCDRVSHREGRIKGIHCSTGQVEIYDLADDPAESNDLSRDRPDLLREFEERIGPWLEIDAAADELDLPGLAPKEIERLRALGYVE